MQLEEMVVVQLVLVAEVVGDALTLARPQILILMGLYLLPEVVQEMVITEMIQSGAMPERLIGQRTLI